MIETHVKIHDRFSFEFKISFISDKTTKEGNEEFKINTWLFIPNSLQINNDTYLKDDFFKDVSSNIRLITPDFQLAEILSNSSNSPKSRLLHALRKLEENLASSKVEEHFVHEIKIFSNICKSAIRDEVNQIILLPDKEVATSCRKLVSDIENILKFYRGLYSQLRQPSPNEAWREYFAYGENYISNTVEKYVFRLLRHSKQYTNYEDIKLPLYTLIQNEQQQRIKKKFPNLEANNPDNNNKVLMQWGILKKVIENALFLHIKRSRDGRWAMQLLYSFAAGLSMLFATIITFTAQRHYEKYTLPLFLIIVVSYMFKDRIKELMRYYFSSQLGKRYFDRKRKLSTRGMEIGVIKDAVGYVSGSKLPIEVSKLRKWAPIVKIENKIYNEQIILYRKLVSLSVSKIASLKGYKYQGINDITKFHLFSLTEKMTDPTLQLYLPDEEQGFTPLIGEKIYPIHFIVRGESNQHSFYRKYRILLNRNGIKEMEELA